MAAVLLKRTSPTVWFSRCLNFNCNLSTLKSVQADAKTVLQSNFSRSVSGYSVRNGSVLSWFPKKATGCRCIPKALSRQYSSVFIKPQRKQVFKCSGVEIPRLEQVRNLPTLNQIRRHKPRTKKRRPKKEIPRDKRILLGPQRKGVCVKLVVRTPKKPNSAQRKCAVLRLSNGKLITAYIPGEKGVLQEHGVVLFEGGRVQDCPGIKYKIIRRKYDMN